MSYRSNPEFFAQKIAKDITKNNPGDVEHLIGDIQSHDYNPAERVVRYLVWLTPDEQKTLFRQLFDALENEVFSQSYIQILQDLAPYIVTVLQKMKEKEVATGRLSFRDTAEFRALLGEPAAD